MCRNIDFVVPGRPPDTVSTTSVSLLSADLVSTFEPIVAVNCVLENDLSSSKPNLENESVSVTPEPTAAASCYNSSGGGGLIDMEIPVLSIPQSVAISSVNAVHPATPVPPVISGCKAAVVSTNTAVSTAVSELQATSYLNPSANLFIPFKSSVARQSVIIQNMDRDWIEVERVHAGDHIPTCPQFFQTWERGATLKKSFLGSKPPRIEDEFLLPILPFMDDPGVYKVHVSGNPGNRIIMFHLVLARKKMTFPKTDFKY